MREFIDSNLDILVFLLKVVPFLKVLAFSTCTLISQPTFSCLLFFIFFDIVSQHNWNYLAYILIYKGAGSTLHFKKYLKWFFVLVSAICSVLNRDFAFFPPW